MPRQVAYGVRRTVAERRRVEEARRREADRRRRACKYALMGYSERADEVKAEARTDLELGDHHAPKWNAAPKRGGAGRGRAATAQAGRRRAACSITFVNNGA